MSLTASQIRQQFIEFFVQRCGHVFVPSSPVVPLDDPTLMFANAGMNQFKPLFLGTADPATEFGRLRRAANSQKCIRAGGKHNDLDDVGKDTYHHTFFEMLGNWSFGDYFKSEAIEWAWELLTGVWGIDPTRLHATYFQGDAAEHLDPDAEARDLWRRILPAERVHPGNKKDNFWEMGDTGPCGPCSEIHIDLTPDKSGASLVNKGDARVMEIWNLVFIQFNRGGDGKLTPLPARHVDTGMGFERVTSVLQGKRSNYDTDIFTPIFAAIQRVTGAGDYRGTLPSAGAATRDELVDVAYRVVADHIRCLTFAITDGAEPSNEGRGYVLRRILRRAFRYGWQYFGLHRPFLCELVPAVVEVMSPAFPELRGNPRHVADVIRDEEESFGRTLERGIALFDEAAQYAVTHHNRRIRGEDAFRLHDTFGFPIDLTQIMAEETGLTVDVAEYERLMEAARERARGATAADAELWPSGPLPPWTATDDSLKYDLAASQANVRGWLQDGRVLQSGRVPDSARIGLFLDRTGFYAEQGGQVGDRGEIETPGGLFVVEDTQRRGDAVVHLGLVMRGHIEVGQRAELRVSELRRPTMQNHTATHLLNWALREVLGDHVQQKGSLVDPDKTRFDFSHSSALDGDEIRRVEALVNEQIRGDLPVHARETAQQDALQINGLRAVFGEKYPDRVRVVSIGPAVEELLLKPDDAKWRRFSVEFCGGTHVRASGAIRRFCIVEESAVAKGVRRLVGVVDEAAEDALRAAAEIGERLDTARRQEGEALVESVSAIQAALDGRLLPVVEKDRARDRLAELMEKVRAFQRQQSRHDTADIVGRAAALLASAERVGGVAIVRGDLGGASADQLRAASDSLRDKAGSAAVVLASRHEGKVVLMAAMTADVVARGVKAGDVIREIAPTVGGRGGGKPDLAQGGGSDVNRIEAALQLAADWLRGRLGQ